MNGAAKPSGSYTELTVDKIHRLVAGRSSMTTLSPDLSDDMFHCAPSALSTDQLLRSRFFTIEALSDSGKDSITFFELESHFASLNPSPPRASSSRSFFARTTASSSSLTDLRQSST